MRVIKLQEKCVGGSCRQRSVDVCVLCCMCVCVLSEERCEGAWRCLGQEQVSVGGGGCATDPQASQVVGVNRFVALQDPDGLVDRKPLTLTADIDRVLPGIQRLCDRQHIHIRPVFPVLVLLKHTEQTS